MSRWKPSLMLVLAPLVLSACVRARYDFIPSEAVAPNYAQRGESAIALEPRLGERRFEEIGIVSVLANGERERERLLRQAASERGAHAVIDVELVTKVPVASFMFIPVKWVKIYAATLIRWERD